MSDTYEFENRNEVLETYEWDNVWWEQMNKQDSPRVLYIGDSISCATRKVATTLSENTILFDGLGTSKAVDNPHFCETIALFAKQQRGRKCILFNNGLHGWHLKDEGEYKQNYEHILRYLLDTFRGTPIVLLLTTSVRNPERDKRVALRNRVVRELAEAYHLPFVDLYSPVKNQPELISADGVHLVHEGYQILASALVDKVRELLGD